MSPILPSFSQLNSPKPSVTGEILTQASTLPPQWGPSVQQLRSGLEVSRVSLDRWGLEGAKYHKVSDLGSYRAEIEFRTPTSKCSGHTFDISQSCSHKQAAGCPLCCAPGLLASPLQEANVQRSAGG